MDAPPLVSKEQWAAVMRPGGNWGFSALLKDTSTATNVESGDRTVDLVVAGRPPYPTELQPLCSLAAPQGSVPTFL
ncbi:hypothetical protein EYF80_046390 [Liparis tanakae]|uniref:Uncharacterized protein n=1 Tax=Liparis tanakae TaxID=230148 RepID=A0A4Z2FSQ2_9TELE|nr:hypothetical protein EYF80_046390 [Liparis tanakae]